MRAAPRLLVSVFCLLLLPLSAVADDLTIRVGYGPGGSYDDAARLLAAHIGRHLPGSPNVVVENVPGAGSLRLAKMVMQSPVTDGSQIATVSSALALLPVFDPGNTEFDPRRVHYLVSMTNSASYCITPKAAGIETLDAFLTEGFKVGATARDSTTYIFPAAIRNGLGANFDIVTGFQAGAEINLAMERGDIQARCGIGITTLFEGDMMERYNVVAELSLEPKHEIEGVPFLLDRAPDAETRAALELVLSSSTVHVPFIAPRATSDQALADLLAAFEALATDQAFIDDAAARGFALGMTSGPEVEALIEGFLSTDPAVQERARAMVQ